MRAIPLLDIRCDFTMRDLAREIANRTLIVGNLEERGALGDQRPAPAGTGAGMPFAAER